MRPDDRIRLQHIIEAGEVIASFVDGADRADLDTDRKLLLALTRAIEIVGEAASRVSAGTRAALPTVPWAQIVAMRNRLIHAYFDIDRDILWRTAVRRSPRC